MFLIKALDFFCLSPPQATGYYAKKFATQTAESLKQLRRKRRGIYPKEQLNLFPFSHFTYPHIDRPNYGYPKHYKNRDIIMAKKAVENTSDYNVYSGYAEF
jgi:hypothetical protein